MVYAVIGAGILAGYLVSRTTTEGERRRLFTLFIAAFAVRVLVAVVLYNLSIGTGGDGYFLGDDDLAYGLRGTEIAEKWKAGVSMIRPENIRYSLRRGGFYWYYLAILMFVSNNNLLVPIFVNCILAGLSALLLYKIARHFLTFKASLAVGYLFSFWPSLVFWSALNLKDAILQFLILGIVLTVVRIVGVKKIDRTFVGNGAALVISLAALFFTQRKIAFFVILAVSVFLVIFSLQQLISGERRRGRAGTMAFVVALLVLLLALPLLARQLVPGAIGTFFTDPVRSLNAVRENRAYGGSAIMPGLRLRSGLDLVWYLPLSFFIGVFYPLPWYVASPMALAAVPELIVWYGLLPFLLKGLFVSLGSGKKRVSVAFLFIASFLFLYLLSLGLFEGNAGTLFRHRGLVVPFALIFITAGLVRHSYEPHQS